MTNDIFKLLHDDHEEVSQLLERLVAADETKERERLLTRIREELLIHSEAEAKTFYRALRDDEKARDNILEAVQEHHLVKQLLNEMARMKADSEQFHAKAEVLQEMVQHHVQEEEGEIFDDAREILKGREDEIGREFEEAKAEVDVS